MISRLDERIKNLSESIKKAGEDETADLNDIRKSMDDLGTRLKTIEDMATRYKGGFIAVLSLGGIIGWIASNFDFVKNVITWFRGS
jgi:hypothetical protein